MQIYKLEPKARNRFADSSKFSSLNLSRLNSTCTASDSGIDSLTIMLEKKSSSNPIDLR